MDQPIIFEQMKMLMKMLRSTIVQLQTVSLCIAMAERGLATAQTARKQVIILKFNTRFQDTK